MLCAMMRIGGGDLGYGGVGMVVAVVHGIRMEGGGRAVMMGRVLITVLAPALGLVLVTLLLGLVVRAIC